MSIFGWVGCNIQSQSTRFELLTPEKSGVHFANHLTPTEEFNMYTFRNFYNGGGVAVGDLNGDELPDLFFTGNMTSNRLYLNQGDLTFRDVTDQSGLNSEGYWSTGVAMADVNSDGHLDLFVTLSGPPEGDARYNRLYLNQGDATFREVSKKWGVDHIGLGTAATFFDADRDGDLDLLLLSNPIDPLKGFQEINGSMRSTSGGELIFYRNNGSEFVEATSEAGFYQNAFSFPLSASVGDLNHDGWLDLYLANDFFERDYLYMNENGKFREVMGELTYTRSQSLSSMGSDIADLDNDGRLDLFVADMRPTSERRLKSKMTFESWDEQQVQIEKGFGVQNTRNSLFRNTAYHGVDQDRFYLAELSRITNTDATDWSWATLMADFDLNGYNDVFVTNGIGKDLLDQDYLALFNNPRVIRERIQSGEEEVILGLLRELSSEPLSDVMYSNMGGFEFLEMTKEWGLGLPGFSSGAAWGDLDGDGDLDLVINQTDGTARIYENRTIYSKRSAKTETNETPSNWLRVDLEGSESNPFAVGARVTAWAENEPYVREHILQRGFQSSVEPGLFFGFGKKTRLDSITVRWPDGDVESFTYNKPITLPARVTLSQSQQLQSRSSVKTEAEPKLQFTEVDPTKIGIDFSHNAYEYSDFRREPLLYHMRSTEGPALCKGDPNGDGLEDIYIGGARDQAGKLYLQREDGNFESILSDLFEKEKISEEVDCAFFDANGDGLDDLYVVSGGNSLVSASTALSDRFYLTFLSEDVSSINTALNNNSVQSSLDVTLIHTEQLLPTNRTFESTSVVAPHDFTGDGIPDLFVGTRLKPFSVGVPVNGYLLEGDGLGGFRDVTNEIAPGILEIGMITHATWADLTGDGFSELLIVGEYMPISIFKLIDGTFTNITRDFIDESTSGWWNRVLTGDWNKDGKTDIIGLNHGLNSIFKASKESPISLWLGDLSGNGLTEHILAIRKQGKDYPVALRHDLASVVPFIGERFPTYADYAGKTVQELFRREELASFTKLEAVMLDSRRFMSQSSSKLSSEPLPFWAQVSPMYGATTIQTNEKEYLVAGGNLYKVKPQVGSYDASVGVVIDLLENKEVVGTGFQVQGEIREILPLTIGKPNTETPNAILVARYGDSPVLFNIHSDKE